MMHTSGMARYKVPRVDARSHRPRKEVASPYVEEARRRLKEGEDDPDALFTLAAWHAVQGEHRKSLAILHRLTQRDPNYPGVWQLKAAVYRELGDEKMAWLCVETSRRQASRA